jgi:hypothetical protein
MALHSLVTLSNTQSTRITPSGVHSGMDITIQNVHDSAYVYIGAESVASSNYGYRLAPGSAFSIELPGSDSLYVITDTNNSKVAVLKTNLESGN